ncbi:hypothetical protein GNF10_25400 [Nostoc sp. UCD121]|uniref:hypothetical protein n=1 Tax=unclassified Nostoc TaxID=2593658 RepID=UPI001627E935|nr:MULTISPECIES: hypothetical protein [unclassified Nostoc]MBC1220961.1 hypothetical protein [Nostoc sp. UCD120]MBC1279207.1 hypothetical protein [Nostoc sp. UCD121]MBC1299627.1 hypothetical protein [Nostoc sp. UCD122]
MSAIQIAEIIEQISQEIEVDANGQAKASVRATARLAGVTGGAVLKTLNTINQEPSKLAQKIQLRGLNIELWRSNGIPDEGVYLIVEYYAFEAGRYCTQKARQAIAHFYKHKTFDGFVYLAFSPEKHSPEKKVQTSLVKGIEKIANPVMEVNTPAGKIDILTIHEIIEVKNVLGWKSAIGQILIYGHYYPNHQKRIHLFGQCCSNTKQLIKFHCDELNIQVTWQ